MLFANCGLNDATMSIILRGVKTIKEIRALTYCRMPIGIQSIRLLEPLIARSVPFNLEELVLIDTRMGASVVEKLADILIRSESKIKKFTLVDVQHSD